MQGSVNWDNITCPKIRKVVHAVNIRNAIKGNLNELDQHKFFNHLVGRHKRKGAIK